MEIKTPRLTLRPAGPVYLESTHAYASDPETTRLMMFLPVDSLEETLRFLENAAAEWAKPEPTYREFVILTDGEHVGGISLFGLEGEPDGAELGWIIRKDRWRQGIAREAAEALMAYAAQEWGVRRFIAQCDSENTASFRLMEKLGMRRIGSAKGRKNRGSDEERVELTYERVL